MRDFGRDFMWHLIHNLWRRNKAQVLTFGWTFAFMVLIGLAAQPPFTPTETAQATPVESPFDADASVLPLFKQVAGDFAIDTSLIRGRNANAAPESFAQARQCLAQAMYFEARSEPVEGWQAVGHVVINRVRSARYPARICDVVFQGDRHRHKCQFSFACDGRSDRAYNKAFWDRAYDLAGTLLTEGSDSEIAGTATHYHADYVAPAWSDHMQPITKIGRHIFYKEVANRRNPLPLKRPEKNL